MLSTQSYQPDAFTRHDLHLLQSIADHVAIAVENAYLYTDLQQRYLTLQEMDHWRAELLQNVSHELRTPLTFLKSYAEMLLDEQDYGSLSEKQRQAIEIMQAKTNNLVRLVEDITTLEIRDEKSLRFRETNLPELTRQAICAAEITAARRGIRLELQAPPAFPALPADPDRITQVLDNLLGNAIKFSHTDSKIVVRVQA